jgi:hypothetical protein
MTLLWGSKWVCDFTLAKNENDSYCFSFGNLVVYVDISDNITEVALSTVVYTFMPGDDVEQVEVGIKKISSSLQLSRVDNELLLHHRFPIQDLESCSRFDCCLGGFLEVALDVQMILREAAKRRTKATRGKELVKRVMGTTSRRSEQ